MRLKCQRSASYLRTHGLSCLMSVRERKKGLGRRLMRCLVDWNTKCVTLWEPVIAREQTQSWDSLLALTFPLFLHVYKSVSWSGWRMLLRVVLIKDKDNNDNDHNNKQVMKLSCPSDTALGFFRVFWYCFENTDSWALTPVILFL